MSEEQPSSSLLRPILIMRDIEMDGAGDDAGKESSKPKKHVTFNRMVEYYTYSETLISWKRRLMSDNDLRRSMPTESKTCFTKH
ncbi:uncharacterized protein LOC6739425 [Drosophila simulans]|uniref:GD15411 n=1 Tax=Drosophila simulans TaxID=7240 RepID=B4NSH5_DROSI|nr:uncharacterized protein LOC6739425 [Drosophila simulans]EDX15553.1 GD15411 [Drosophila simulans]KMY93494.1 uncharacterized protein Dsimw501_GD15411 [Drosophila simulans]